VAVIASTSRRPDKHQIFAMNLNDRMTEVAAGTHAKNIRDPR